MENDWPDASESESESESESNASVEPLACIPAPPIAKPPRTVHYLENKGRMTVFVTSTQDLCLFGLSMQAPMIQAPTNTNIMGQQSDCCITTSALSV